MPVSLQSSLQTLEDKFQYLDRLPEALYETIVTHPHGELNQRIEGILQWREALLLGQLPREPGLHWPEARIARMLLKRLDVLDIVTYCKNQETLTDSILQDVCEAVSSAEQWQEIDPGFDDKLARQQKRRDKDSPFQDTDTPLQDNDTAQVNNKAHTEAADKSAQNEQLNAFENSFNETPGKPAVSEPASLESSEIQNDSFSSEQADHSANPFLIQNESILEQSWLELSRQWHRLEPVFSELSSMLGRGWDLTQGLLASQQWRDIIRYRKLVKQLPWLEQVVAALGRLQEINSAEPLSRAEQIFEPVKRMIEQEVEVKTPHAVSETSGIRRSDDIARLLPGELVQLGHPQLNRLWHAKRAEHTLLTYQVQGVLSEHEPQEVEQLQETEQATCETESGLGPILVCLDGSASMQGEPENIAKALVLEALRIAWQEQRACYVYLFSGPQQVLQHELDLTRGGLSELLDFLTQTFHGGTDVIKPLLTAIEKTQQENWHKADILLVSDGRFPVTDEHRKIIKKLTSRDIRLHGVLIGQWQGRAMQTLCTHFHRVNS